MGNPELSSRKGESATAIPQGSRHQAMPKRPAPSPFVMKGDDMVYSVQQCMAALEHSLSTWYDRLYTTGGKLCESVRDVSRVKRNRNLAPGQTLGNFRGAVSPVSQNKATISISRTERHTLRKRNGTMNKTETPSWFTLRSGTTGTWTKWLCIPYVRRADSVKMYSEPMAGSVSALRAVKIICSFLRLTTLMAVGISIVRKYWEATLWQARIFTAGFVSK